MDIIQPCEMQCGNAAQQRHHLFSNTKLNRKLYGKLLDDNSNIMLLCSSCHLNKSVPKQLESEFCSKLGIEPRSKSAQKVRKI